MHVSNYSHPAEFDERCDSLVVLEDQLHQSARCNTALRRLLQRYDDCQAGVRQVGGAFVWGKEVVMATARRGCARWGGAFVL